MRAEHHVVRPQVGAHADGDGLLSDVGVARAVDQPALVRLRQLLLAAADRDHAAVKVEWGHTFHPTRISRKAAKSQRGMATKKHRGHKRKPRAETVENMTDLVFLFVPFVPFRGHRLRLRGYC